MLRGSAGRSMLPRPQLITRGATRARWHGPAPRITGNAV